MSPTPDRPKEGSLTFGETARSAKGAPVTFDAPIDPDGVRALAVHADLPLAKGRDARIAPVLGAWLVDANALSRKMSAPEYWTLAPVTIFSHPALEDHES